MHSKINFDFKNKSRSRSGNMAKFSNMLYMIDLLNTGNIYSVKELSEKIGVSERMIRYYKDEIFNNGIAIESFKGPKGGYFMIDKVKNYVSINKYDVQLLENIYNILKNNNFEYLKDYEDFLNKVKKMYSIYDEKSKFISNVNIDSSDKIQKLIKDAIDKSDKVEITYNNVNGKQTTRTIHPLQLFKYKDSYYVTAYCELRHDIRHFELDRITNIK